MTEPAPCYSRFLRWATEAARDHRSGSVILDPCRVGSRCPDQLGVDTRERGGMWAVREVEQHGIATTPCVLLSDKNSGVGGKRNGSYRSGGGGGVAACGRRLRADLHSQVSRSFTPRVACLDSFQPFQGLTVITVGNKC